MRVRLSRVHGGVYVNDSENNWIDFMYVELHLNIVTGVVSRVNVIMLLGL